MFGRKKRKKALQNRRKTAEIIYEKNLNEESADNLVKEDKNLKEEGVSFENEKERTYDSDVMSLFSMEKRDGEEVSYEENPNRNERTLKSKKKKKIKKIIIVLILLSIASTCAFFVMRMPYFNIKGIDVVGNKNISKETVLKDSKIKVGGNIFFINKSQIKSRMKENPYYKDIDIDRVLPSKINITISERYEKAVLPYGEKYVILDDEGTVLKLSKTRPQVTEIRNVTIKNMDKGEVVEVKQKDIFQKSLEVIRNMEKNDLFCKSISLDKNEIECNVYSTLYIRGNYDKFMKYLKDGSLKSVLADVYKKNIKRGTVNITEEGVISFTPTFK